MSFRCQECNEGQKPGIKPTLVVTKLRPVSYLHSRNVTGSGHEIIKELIVCERCRCRKFLLFVPQVIGNIKYIEVKEGHSKKKKQREYEHREQHEPIIENDEEHII